MCYGDGWKGQSGWWVPVPAHLQEKDNEVVVGGCPGAGGSPLCLPGCSLCPPQLCFCSVASLDLSSPFPAPSALPFAGCDSPWRVPAPTSPAHSTCDVPWARSEPQLTAAFPNPDTVPVASGCFFGRGVWEQPPSEHLSAVRECHPSLSSFSGNVWQS